MKPKSKKVPTQANTARPNKDQAIKTGRSAQAAPKPEASVLMPTAQVRPAAENPLTRSAMLVCVSIHMWGNRVKESKFSDQVAAAGKTDKDMIHTTKKLVARDAITVVTSAFSRFKAHHYESTLPWDNNGYRILPAANFLHYVEEERRLKSEAQDAVEEFLKVYPSVRAAAQKKLGDAFNNDEYPTPAELKHRYSIDTHFMSIPDKADFRVDVPASELARINADIDAQIADGLKHATNDLFERLHRVVLAMRDKLKEFRVVEQIDAGGKKKRKTENHFRDTLVTNIRDLCDMLPRLNVTGDANLARLCAEAAAGLGAFDPEALREDDSVRANAIAKADALLGAMAGYV